MRKKEDFLSGVYDEFGVQNPKPPKINFRLLRNERARNNVHPASEQKPKNSGKKHTPRGENKRALKQVSEKEKRKNNPFLQRVEKIYSFLGQVFRLNSISSDENWELDINCRTLIYKDRDVSLLIEQSPKNKQSTVFECEVMINNGYFKFSLQYQKSISGVKLSTYEGKERIESSDDEGLKKIEEIEDIAIAFELLEKLQKSLH